MKKVDEDGYNKGQAAFRKGASLRSIIEPNLAAEAEDQGDYEKRSRAENFHMSVFLGFADGLLELVRRRR